jgi:hypothetical protein
MHACQVLSGMICLLFRPVGMPASLRRRLFVCFSSCLSPLEYRAVLRATTNVCLSLSQMGNDIIGRRMSSAREAVLQTMLDESWAALNISDEVLACAHEHDLVLSAAGRCVARR